MNCYNKITGSQIPVIHESSNSSSLKVKTGKPAQWGCYIEKGMPPPTVTWFKVSYIVY